MLVRGRAARTTANFYLVPGIVAVLAWALLDEHLGALALLGLLAASLGCWLVNVAARGIVRGAAALSDVDDTDVDRSEEHTSELQSLMRISYAVFCLKKNK